MRSAQLRRSPLSTLLQDSLTVFWGDWLDLRVRIVQIVSSGLVSPLIYILAFGLGLGSSLDTVTKPSAGDNYLQFILPGMVALSSMVISFGGTTFSICGDRLFTKTFEEMLLMPVHPLAVHLGKMMAGILRGLLTASSVILVAIIFTGKVWSFLNPLFLLVLTLNCAVFAGLGVIVGLNVKSLEGVGIYNNFVIVPMSFLGGTFFDASTLPIALKAIVYLLPLTYTTLGMRAAAYLPIQQFPWFVIPVLLVMAIVLSGIGAYQFSHLQD
ncbi:MULTISPECIES: ABC transporter permease [Leptolyngbya]|uniref:Transport permease protein n=2 Tax=Leptolyngbya boryana TaxID=1184 RepID=A0A1Z4JM81_LEPBY|nr:MULTISPECIES: ABC transporter permease [Leptolyngbya]BAY57758.1 ABC transporter [Leptolyngbya boryana NIES-2135]MBD1858673.1 ABC transporter permease [Leptolyngbya sp. FACHB-1624]MBD2367708.1 ABC transporter permease [Leptolyngbya sp. FACHB-161]MBD2374232.1 ABC transporter permease [Leptolyngbya sp. FACHB-238]MBD2398857.1 ABC transporter permease [Leptolyngbya sp. FACHB-239]